MLPDTPSALARWLDGRLRELAGPEFAAGQRHFFQHEIDTYGVRAKPLHQLSNEVYRAVKSWPVEKRDQLMELLWKNGRIEAGGVVCYVYRRFARACGEREFDLFESWIDRYVNNWAMCDGISSWLLAACIANRPALHLRLKGWTKAKSRWKRRASAVALVQEARQGRSTEFIFTIAERLLADRDDMVEKGLGWMLKETYPKQPEPTRTFLLEHGREASRLVLRIAAEKMTPEDRAAVLRR